MGDRGVARVGVMTDHRRYGIRRSRKASEILGELSMLNTCASVGETGLCGHRICKLILRARVFLCAEPWHGTPGGYTNHNCRCDDCRQAWADYQRGRKVRA